MVTFQQTFNTFFSCFIWLCFQVFTCHFLKNVEFKITKEFFKPGNTAKVWKNIKNVISEFLFDPQKSRDQLIIHVFKKSKSRIYNFLVFWYFSWEFPVFLWYLCSKLFIFNKFEKKYYWLFVKKFSKFFCKINHIVFKFCTNMYWKVKNFSDFTSKICKNVEKYLWNT